MTEVIALLEASTRKAAIADEPESRPLPNPKIGSATSSQRPGTSRQTGDPTVLIRREEREGLLIKHDWSLEDLVLGRRPADSPVARKSREAQSLHVKRTPFRGQSLRMQTALVAVGAIALILAGFVGAVVSWRPVTVMNNPKSEPIVNAGIARDAETIETAQPPQMSEMTTIFDGKSGQGWMLCNRTPLPRKNIQHDGLNPHSTGSYLVVYDRKLGDFVLDFDYMLSAGCNSGVFLRVSDLNNPVNTGIEVALDDTRHGDDRDSGAFHGLVAPQVYAQKPSGQWNHMTITASGSLLTVTLNDNEVSSIDLDLWTLPGKRPDGSMHQFKERAIAWMARTGYLGFQDLGGDCWFKNITLRTDSNPRRIAPTSP